MPARVGGNKPRSAVNLRPDGGLHALKLILSPPSKEGIGTAVTVAEKLRRGLGIATVDPRTGDP